MAFPPVPTPQGANSKTFVAPPVDGSLSVPQVFDFNAEHSPDYPFCVYEKLPDTESSELASKDNLEHITYKQLQRGIHRVSRLVKSTTATATPSTSTVVGILALADTVTYFSLVQGIIRAGLQPFPISPRNSPAALAHLLQKTKTAYLYVSGDPNMTALSGAGLKAAAAAGHAVEKLALPKFHDLYEAPHEDDALPVPPATPVEDLDTVALYLHSSGSTSFPKPIPITHRILIEWMRIPHYGEVDVSGSVFGTHALPIFHALGIINAHNMVSAGAIMAIFNPASKPGIPTPEALMAAVIATKCEYIFSVPSFIEAWAQDPASVTFLKTLKALMSSGGPLSQVIGDSLAAQSVPLVQIYGITEMSAVSQYTVKGRAYEDWEYWKVSPQFDYRLAPQENPNEYEFQGLPCDTQHPAVLNTTIEGKPGYATNDLIAKHPTKEGLFKLLGRGDDQIMLSTGEKTNPGPLEAIIAKDPRVAGAVFFGRAKPHNGVIIHPVQPVDSTDREAVSKFINAIWPSVELANTYAPSHSRLFKQMIIITSLSKPMPMTAKGSIQKSSVVKLYQDEIEATYNSLEANSTADVPAPKEWTKEATLDFVRAVVIKVLEEEIPDDADIFTHGGDSLQATFIGNTIINALKKANIDTGVISSSFLYSSPTIVQLGAAVYGFVDPSSLSSVDKVEAKVLAIKEHIAKYTSDFPVHTPSASAPTSEVVVLTGSTGGLGTTLLVQLVERESVSKIYAINRKSSGKSLKDRQIASLHDRGHDVNIVNSEKVVLLEGDTSAPFLGLPEELYQEICQSATSIVHNAWRVDFNLSLTSFDPLFRGLRNLIDVALQSPLPSPPRVMFASSVSIFSNWSSTEPAKEEHLEDAFTAVGGGYGESKYVAEHILHHASKKTPLQPIVVRLGQLSGGKNGSWNVSEWLPAVVRSGEVVGCLPASDDSISWLPLHTAASAIVDFHASPNTPQTVHLVHPRGVSWTDVFAPIAQALNVPLVPYAEWLERLEADLADTSKTQVEAVKENPALLLIDMFRPYKAGETKDEARDAFGVVQLATEKAASVSRALHPDELPPLGQTDAESWVSYWRKAGHLRSAPISV